MDMPGRYLPGISFFALQDEVSSETGRLYRNGYLCNLNKEIPQNSA